MLLICMEGFTDDPPDEALVSETRAWVAEMNARGVRTRTGSRLRPTADAITVRTREGEVLISDGPFAETKEQIAGFDLIECDNIDEAIEIAAKHPCAKRWSIEVRPFWEG
jgi:hypothetical protein